MSIKNLSKNSKKEILITAKFGGSSLSNKERILNVKDIILSNPRRRFVVVSAPGKDEQFTEKITDTLYKIAKLVSVKASFEKEWRKIVSRFSNIISSLGLESRLGNLLPEVLISIKINPYTDFIVSRGEYMQAKILAELLKSLGKNAFFIDAGDMIFFDSKGFLDYEKTQKAVNKKCSAKGIFIIPGFYGKTESGKIKTFTRGGSDITGALVACALKTPLYENWTDVSGFFTADPRIVKEAKTIKEMTYREARALSYAGATVLHEETVGHLIKGGITLVVRNTHHPKDPGTFILPSSPKSDKVTGVAGKKGFLIFTVEKTMTNEVVGFGRKLLDIFEKAAVSYDHEVTGIDTTSIIVDQSKIFTAGKNDVVIKNLISKIKKELQPDKITLTPEVGIIAVVSRSNYDAKAFVRLSNELIKKNIKIIMQSMEPTGQIIVAVPNDSFASALKIIHTALF
jgi:aspartate kinase